MSVMRVLLSKVRTAKDAELGRNAVAEALVDDMCTTVFAIQVRHPAMQMPNSVPGAVRGGRPR